LTPVARSSLHVRHRIDSDRIAEISVRQHEREPTHDPLTNAELGSNTEELRSNRWKALDQASGSFDSHREPHAATWTLVLVPIDRGIEL